MVRFIKVRCNCKSTDVTELQSSNHLGTYLDEQAFCIIIYPLSMAAELDRVRKSRVKVSIKCIWRYCFWYPMPIDQSELV